jgi:hypothetical protein
MNMSPPKITRPTPQKLARAAAVSEQLDKSWVDVEKFINEQAVSPHAKALSLKLCRRALPQWIERCPTKGSLKPYLLFAAEGVVNAYHDKDRTNR